MVALPGVSLEAAWVAVQSRKRRRGHYSDLIAHATELRFLLVGDELPRRSGQRLDRSPVVLHHIPARPHCDSGRAPFAQVDASGTRRNSVFLPDRWPDTPAGRIDLPGAALPTGRKLSGRNSQ